MLLSNFNEFFKVIVKVSNVQFGPLLYIWAYISETVHTMVNVYLWHIYNVIYLIFQFTLLPVTLDDRKRSNKVTYVQVVVSH